MRLLSPPASLHRHHYLNACKTTTTTLKIRIVVVPVVVLSGLFVAFVFYSSAEPVCTEILLLHAENFRPRSRAKPDDFRAGTKSYPG